MFHHQSSSRLFCGQPYSNRSAQLITRTSDHAGQRLLLCLQVVLLFLQNMNLLLSKTPKADIQNHVLPMLFRSVEADSPQIQVIGQVCSFFDAPMCK